jgi:hypothetical protein
MALLVANACRGCGERLNPDAARVREPVETSLGGFRLQPEEFPEIFRLKAEATRLKRVRRLGQRRSRRNSLTSGARSHKTRA